ncbi:MAG: AbrB family transcriptional regulator [Alphaproteobacteria bacterium]|nr:AbrB family transcriptional regulator [Alphaproteobacteria bacterium]
MPADAPETAPLTPVRKLSRADIPVFARTVAIGVTGGALFNYLDLPLAWMMGAMVATALATLGRLETNMDSRLRTGMIIVLGVLLGSAFSPDILDRITLWPITLAALVVYVLVSTIAAFLYFHLVAGFDRNTAFFAGVPGGLNEMIVLAQTFGGDDRQVSVAHSTRIFLVVMTLPFMFRALEDFETGLRTFGKGDVALGLVDVALLGASAVVGLYGAKLLRIPAPHLAGPMIASATVHLTGLTAAAPPVLLVAGAQVILGASVGARFAGLTFRDLGRILRLGGVATLLLLSISALFALVLQAITGIPFAPLVLAFSPGGFTEMSLVALAMNIDTAFVATHHIARISVVVILVPLLFRILIGRDP